MAPRRRCPVCRSKKWRKEPSSGRIACSEGHILQNYIEESNDNDEWNATMTTHQRNIKSTATKEKKEGKASNKAYHGSRAQFHNAQCQQLLLRHQIASLTALWNLPPEFEIICRDTWALHISLLPKPLPAEPYHFKNGSSEPEAPGSHSRKNSQGSDNDSDLSPSSSAAGDGEREEDPDILEMLRENSETDSSDEEDSKAPTGVHIKRKRQTRSEYAAPANNIAVLILSCWTLRIPIIYADFVNIIEAYDLPYLDPLRYLPPTMTSHLSRDSRSILSPQIAPNVAKLHAHTSRLAKKFFQRCGIRIPELNAAPILWRAVRHLQCPPVVYILSKRIARTLSLTLTLHSCLAPNLEQTSKHHPTSRIYDHAPPEITLVAVVVVALKIIYGLDGEPRVPEKADDPACFVPRLDQYLKLIREHEEADTQSKEAQFGSTNQMSVERMSEARMDEYLQFCEKALINPNASMDDRDRASLEQYFPFHSNIGLTASIPMEVEVSQPILEPVISASDSRAARPGEGYSVYDSKDVTGILPDSYHLVLARAARWASVDGDYLSVAIEQIEKRLLKSQSRHSSRGNSRDSSTSAGEESD